ncbi:hypothetical protein FNAPI_6689 [Fusarium napiforme]|uniref:Uncharacterized protein n=1 Tax=Fusarium napiforme TaxID=42672 RepID=A0A8H5N5Q9_9HYPO|nr:hypothetical protein FNAPI_6689 [Fusarium napiforme]
MLRPSQAAGSVYPRPSTVDYNFRVDQTKRFPRNLIIRLSPLNPNVPVDLTHQLDHPKLAHPYLTTKAHLGASVARKGSEEITAPTSEMENNLWRLKKCSGSEGDLVPGDEGQALRSSSFVGANVQIILGEIGWMEQNLVNGLNAIEQGILSNITYCLNHLSCELGLWELLLDTMAKAPTVVLYRRRSPRHLVRARGEVCSEWMRKAEEPDTDPS